MVQETWMVQETMNDTGNLMVQETMNGTGNLDGSGDHE